MLIVLITLLSKREYGKERVCAYPKKHTNTPHVPADYSHHKPQTALPAAHAGNPPRRADQRNLFVVGARNLGLVGRRVVVGRRKVGAGNTPVVVEGDTAVVGHRIDCIDRSLPVAVVGVDSRRGVVAAGEDIDCKGRTFLRRSGCC